MTSATSCAVPSSPAGVGLRGGLVEVGHVVLDHVPVATFDEDRAGRHDVAADALRAEHLRLAERPVGDGGLERAVAARPAAKCSAVAVVPMLISDPPPSASASERGAGAVDERHEVDVEVVDPRLDGACRLAGGVVHVDVDAAELLDR